MTKITWYIFFGHLKSIFIIVEVMEVLSILKEFKVYNEI
jgi:hypothetical protein